MSSPVETGKVQPGDFPFPLTRGPNESRFLTWLRNHSNYLAVRGLLDYFRMAAVLMRGILVNNLVIIPVLLLIALALGLLYGSLLTDWDEQAVQTLKKVREAAVEVRKLSRAARAANVEMAPDAPDDQLLVTFPARREERAEGNEHDLKAVTPDAKQAREALTKARQELRQKEEKLEQANEDRRQAPMEFFFTKKVVDTNCGWVFWMQEHLDLTPPYLLTPLVLSLAALWVVLFPVVMMLAKIAGYRKSLATGSDSSVKSRDRYERTFGATLFVVLAVVSFESLPLLAYAYHQFRMKIMAGSLLPGTHLLVATIVLCVLSGAPKLLSMLGGAWKVAARVAIALVGLFVPLMVVVVVTDFLVYAPVPVERFAELFLFLLLAPGVYAAVIAIAMIVGFVKRTFTSREFVRLFALLVGTIAFHLALLVAVVAVYAAVYYLYQAYPRAVPEILLNGDPTADRGKLQEYGDVSAYYVLACALEISLSCWLVVDVNLTSMHGFYRDRLASAYLLGITASDQVDIEEDVPLSELGCHETFSTAPYHLINVALNLQGSKDIGLRDRESDFFIFSKKYIGGERTGYCRSTTMEQVFPQIDLASAMAISAAAASPNMGRSTSRALVAFMTLINARLGVWVPNPGLLEDALAGLESKRRTESEPTGRKPGYSFSEVFLDELLSIEKRWKCLGPRGNERRLDPTCRSTPATAHGLAGICFSGGGIRSATINLGIAQALHDAGIFEHFDYMSTVSGGGYLGSSISTLMRNKTPPVSEIAGEVSVDNADSDKIVTVTGTQPGEVRMYRYAEHAELEVKSGDRVTPGTRLIRRPGPRVRSEIAGKVSIETAAGGQKFVRVTGSQPGDVRQYRYAKYDQLAVRDGDSVAVGHQLAVEPNTFGKRFAWQVPPRALLREMTMRLDETYSWVNLSDGGHIENLAAIELLRRRCKFIVIGDGEADPNLYFAGLATLMRTAYIDLGIDIDICLDTLRLDEKRCSKEHVVIGKIRYPGQGEGYLLYLKSSYTGDESESIGEYRHRNPAFPHESTADQFFDEGQFEAYRALGQHLAEKAIAMLAPSDPAGKMTYAELVRCFEALRDLEEKKKAATAAVVGE
jgi:hypothetical protein